MSEINFEAKVIKIESTIVIKLPKSVSAKLPSRGMTMVNVSINDFSFDAALEPDGSGSHWFEIEEKVKTASKLKVDDVVDIKIQIVDKWPEPNVPSDINKEIKSTSQASILWKSITPRARWDWIRWVNSTKNSVTREKRIKNMFSMLRNGKKRPCCFNRTACTNPYLSKNGILLQ